MVEADSVVSNQVISVPGPGRFRGELGWLTGEAAYYGAVALTEAAVLAIPVDAAITVRGIARSLADSARLSEDDSPVRDQDIRDRLAEVLETGRGSQPPQPAALRA